MVPLPVPGRIIMAAKVQIGARGDMLYSLPILPLVVEK